jgi:dihydroorotase
MSLKLNNVRVLDRRSSHHQSLVSLEIDKGKILKIGPPLNQSQGVIDMNGVIVSPGWVDMSSSFGDPGYEHREDIFSGLECAKYGGFTHVLLQPNTNPVIDNKSAVEYVLTKSRGHVVELHPMAAISNGNKGEMMSEMVDLLQSGAVAFTEGVKSTDNSELLLKALQYTSGFNGLVINRPEDPDLARFGQMHEGSMSTSLGMKGIPALAEIIMIERDLNILRYTGGRLHFSSISAGESVEVLAKAKKEGLNVSCDVAIHNLLLTDESLSDFDTNYKVNPPLRSEKDRKALIKGLKNGTIDAITSDHQPHDTEEKNLEFDLADFGITSLQTVLPSIITLSKELPLELLLEKISNGPRAVLGWEPIIMEEGHDADFTLIDPDHEWRYDHATNHSKSLNSPYFGQDLKGICAGVIRGKNQFIPKRK